MNKMWRVIVVVIFLTPFSINGYGQVLNVNDANGVPLMTQKYEEIEGSPYYGDGNWFIGSMTNVDGDKIDNAQLRFNAFDNELEFYRNGRPFIVSKSDINAFDLLFIESNGNTSKINFKNGFEIAGEIEKSEYVRVIYDGSSMELVQRIYKDQIQVTPASYGESDYTKFVDNNSYFLKSLEQSEEIKLNKKTFLKLMPSKKGAIKNFISSEEIDFNNMNDVQELMEFLEETQS